MRQEAHRGRRQLGRKKEEGGGTLHSKKNTCRIITTLHPRPIFLVRHLFDRNNNGSSWTEYSIPYVLYMLLCMLFIIILGPPCRTRSPGGGQVLICLQTSLKTCHLSVMKPCNDSSAPEENPCRVTTCMNCFPPPLSTLVMSGAASSRLATPSTAAAPSTYCVLLVADVMIYQRDD